MSRIHEALKKAAEDRSSRHSDPATDQGSTSTVELFGALPKRPELETSLKPTETTGRENYRLEDLAKRCVQATWQPDPRFNVFEGAKEGAERFRTLRSRIYQIAVTRNLRRILVTSSVPGEGKTFVTANLAHAITRQPDRRVLLIDADLRIPRLHVLLGAPNQPGLSDYLSGAAEMSAVIQKGPRENLFFIPSGKDVTNPSELLLGGRMKQLLDQVTPVFDFVILDSPPTIPVHDASMLAGLCDGVLFVVNAGVTRLEIAEKGTLEFRDKKLLGVVLNRVDKLEGNKEYHYGYSPKEE